MTAVHPGRRLREALDRGTVVAPGAFNGLAARAVAAAGFEACYVSGAATANGAGFPDIGLITLTEMCRTIAEITQACGLPVIADADTGYGAEASVARTVVEYERAGAAALHVEDQVLPKRCGHLAGKELVPAGHMAEKVAAACAARSSDDLVIIARTDARAVSGLDDAIARAALYRQAGADMIFPEGLESEAEFAEFAERCPGPSVANMTEFGGTPDLPASRFGDLGYRLVIYPVSLQRLAMGQVVRGLAELRDRGTLAGLLDAMQTRQELYDLLGYDPDRPWRFPGTPMQ
jgi:methylisocitrate lyase